MDLSVTAIYEHGILRLLTPLALPEHTRVRVYVEPILEPDEPDHHRRQVDKALRAAGLIQPTAEHPPAIPPISPKRHEELARRFSVGKPLSELILEERNGR